MNSHMGLWGHDTRDKPIQCISFNPQHTDKVQQNDRGIQQVQSHTSPNTQKVICANRIYKKCIAREKCSFHLSRRALSEQIGSKYKLLPSKLTTTLAFDAEAEIRPVWKRGLVLQNQALMNFQSQSEVSEHEVWRPPNLMEPRFKNSNLNEFSLNPWVVRRQLRLANAQSQQLSIVRMETSVPF